MAEPWRKRVVIGDAVLLLGNCLEILPHLPKVDAVITDPPYGDRTHKGARTNKIENAPVGYRQGGAELITFAALTDEEFVGVCRALLGVATRWVVMTCDHRHAALTFDWPEHIRLGVWVKIAPMPQITGDRPGSGHESVLILHNVGKKAWNGGGKPAVWTATVIKDPAQSFVPSQKPLKLIIDIANDFTLRDETILDPFMGSGTTGVACMQLGRKFIGIEIEPKYFDIAVERITNAQRQQRMFA